MGNNAATGLKCPECGCLDNTVMDSRSSNENTQIRRRRKCESCDHRFTTRELAFSTLTGPVLIYPDGRLMPFDQNGVALAHSMADEVRALVLEKVCHRFGVEI